MKKGLSSRMGIVIIICVLNSGCLTLFFPETHQTKDSITEKELFSQAIREGDIDFVMERLEMDSGYFYDKNILNWKADNLIDLAANAGQTELVVRLLNFQLGKPNLYPDYIPIEHQELMGSIGSNLALAVFFFHYQAVRLLKDGKNDLDKHNTEGKNALHIAIDLKDEDCYFQDEIIREFIKLGMDIYSSGKNRSGKNIESPFQYAIDLDKMGLCMTMTHFQDDYYLKTGQKDSGISITSEKVIELVYGSSKDRLPDYEYIPNPVFAVSDYLKSSDENKVLLLLDFNRPLSNDQLIDCFKQTLFKPVSEKTEYVLKLISEKQVSFEEICFLDLYMWGFFDYEKTSFQDKVSKLEFFVEHGEDINKKNRRGFSVLHDAIGTVSYWFAADGKTCMGLPPNEKKLDKESYNLSWMHYFEKLGSDFSIIDNYGNNLLFNAAYMKDRESVLYLLNKGLNINKVNKYAHTPLHMAITNQDKDMERLLLEHGAEPIYSE